jgi:hypothetical protein
MVLFKSFPPRQAIGVGRTSDRLQAAVLNQ